MNNIFKKNDKPILVLTAATKWDEPPRMRHYIAIYLANYFNIIFCELNGTGLPKLTYINESLVIFKVGLYIPGVSRFNFLNKAFNKVQAFIISQKISSLKSNKIILLNFKFDFLDIFHHQIFSIKYLFINDDFINMNPRDTLAKREENRNTQAIAVNNCDRVFVSSDPLAKDILEHGKPISIIYSGHDFNPLYNELSEKSDQLRVCFMGYIHNRLESKWIERLANEHNTIICLIGPIESEEIYLTLSKYKNITFHPPIVGKELQKYMSKFDVFIMPYTDEPVNTKASVPAKLFQYLACGKPIVSSLMRDLIDLPEGFLYFSENAEDFVNKVIKAKRDDSLYLKNLRIDFAMENDWEKRAKQMHEIIHNDMFSKLDHQP